MSSRKLSVEVELETAKAKRQAADLAHVENAAEPVTAQAKRPTADLARVEAPAVPVAEASKETKKAVSNVSSDSGASGEVDSEALEKLSRNLNAAAKSAELVSDACEKTERSIADLGKAAESAFERQKAETGKDPVVTGEKASEAAERLTRNLNAAADSASKAARKAKLPDVEEPGKEIPEYAKKLSGTFGDLSKDLDKASDSAKRMDGSTKQLVRGFTGLAVGLAGSYAASHMKQGAARDAVEYGTSAISGASAGAMMGSVIPGLGTAVGAIAGGAVGLGKTWLDKSGEKSKYTEEWERSEEDYKLNKEYADFIMALTDMSDKTKSITDRLETAKEQLDASKKTEVEQVAEVNKMIKEGRYDDANIQRGYLSQNRSRQAQLETLIKRWEDQLDKGGVRASLGAVDALSRLGGDFTGGGGQGMDIQKEQLDVLRSIDRKTGGTAKWR